jgi:hypothetical protein
MKHIQFWATKIKKENMILMEEFEGEALFEVLDDLVELDLM